MTNCGLLIKKKKKYEYKEYNHIVGYFRSFFGRLAKVLCQEVPYYLVQYEKGEALGGIN